MVDAARMMATGQTLPSWLKATQNVPKPPAAMGKSPSMAAA